MVSCMFVLLTHLLLSLVPRFFSAPSFLAQLALSALLLLFFVGFGGWCQRSLLKRRASAPAFVFFNVLFIWGFYILVIRQAVPLLNNAVFSCEVVFLLIGLYSIIKSYPGFVTNGFASSDQVVAGSVSQVDNHEKELEVLTSGLCHQSTESFSGFWFGYEGTILQELQGIHKGSRPPLSSFWELYRPKESSPFLILLFGLISTKASYLVCASLFAAKSWILRKPSLEPTLSENSVVSTILFVILHLVRQINWKNYPEFQRVVQPHPGKNFTSIRFRNPYDKGILQNVREFLALRA